MDISKRNTAKRLGLAGLALVMTGLISACSPGGFSFLGGGAPAGNKADAGPAATLSGKTIGAGPVKVALLLPLSGDATLSAVGNSMANAAELAMDFVKSNPNLGENITLVIKDSGANALGASSAAQQALAEGASLILGPLRADQVTVVGDAARQSGVNVIAFSNNPGAASAGVFLLNVLPETEVKRSMNYAQKLGKKAFAGIFPNNDFGRLQQGAFQQTMADLGLQARAIYNFSNEAEARAIIAQLTPLLQQGQIDSLFIPDRATAPSFGNMLQEAGIQPGTVQLVGSSDWATDATIGNTTSLAGAIFPALDDAGLMALSAEYQTRFGSAPHPLATLAYTATILANAKALANGTPRYDRTLLTNAAGFSGRDGVFRFLPDGRSEFALTIRQVSIGGSSVAEGAPKKF